MPANRRNLEEFAAIHVYQPTRTGSEPFTATEVHSYNDWNHAPR